MAKKSLGYVELEWTCPNCSTRNPGTQKTCVSCGMPQPDDVQFEQPAEEKIITDEATLQKASAGPDIHCRYCGSRNAGNATNCSQCGADLTEGEKRTSGQVLGAHRDQPAAAVDCPACGTSNAADAPKCIQCGASLVTAPPLPEPKLEAAAAKSKSSGGLLKKIGLGIAVIALCACAMVGFVLFNRTEDVTGTVTGVSWDRTIIIEELVPVTHEDWHNTLPADSVRGSCTPKLRRTQDDPAPGAREVCGTPFTVDKGSGLGEVVQECKYEIYEDYCEYTVEEWQEDDEVSLTGQDFSPVWPEPNLAANQRQGEQEERFTCHFRTESGERSYSTSNIDTWKRCQTGSRWILQINTFNMITGIEPAQ